jgi:hypothetical protein
LIDCCLMSKELSISYSILAILRRSLQTIHPVRYKGGTGTFYEQMLVTLCYENAMFIGHERQHVAAPKDQLFVVSKSSLAPSSLAKRRCTGPFQSTFL